MQRGIIYWDFTPPSCSLGLDFGFTPPGPATTTAVPIAAPAPTVVLSTTPAPAAAPADQRAPLEPAVVAPMVQRTPATPASVLALQSPTAQDIKKAGDKRIVAKPVSWAGPSDYGKSTHLCLRFYKRVMDGPLLEDSFMCFSLLLVGLFVLFSYVRTSSYTITSFCVFAMI